MGNQKQASFLFGVVHEFPQKLYCLAVTVRRVLQELPHVDVPVLEVAQQLVLPVRLLDEFVGDQEGSPEKVMFDVLHVTMNTSPAAQSIQHSTSAWACLSSRAFLSFSWSLR